MIGTTPRLGLGLGWRRGRLRSCGTARAPFAGWSGAWRIAARPAAPMRSFLGWDIVRATRWLFHCL